MYLVLASKSPRRKEILTQAGYKFKIDVSSVDETVPEIEAVSKVQAIAKKKGLAVFSKYNDSNVVVLSADTIVVINGEILGKPKDKNDARRMISMLQGKTHQVYTGVFIQSIYGQDIFYEKTDVVIKEMTHDEIESYISIDEPYDKAGSYAIQGVFSKYIASINGDYYNVMGLPINKVSEYLSKYNFTDDDLGLAEAVPNIKICSRCGKSNKETNKYCEYCGSELVDFDTPIQVVGECPICHHVNDENDQYCRICGTILNRNVAPSGMDPRMANTKNINNNINNVSIPQSNLKLEKFATAGLILGICSCVLNFMCFTSFIAIVAGIIGIIFSAISLRNFKTRNISIIGLILSIVGSILSVTVIIALLGGFNTDVNVDDSMQDMVRIFLNLVNIV